MYTIKDLYDLAVQCRDEKSIIALFKDAADRHNVSYRYIVMLTREYGKENGLKSAFEVIYEKEIKVISDMVSKDPHNLRKCFRQYVSQTYPELTKPGISCKEYDRQVARIACMWYRKCSKQHVCFMTVSKKGKAIVNGKSTVKNNDNYTKGFFNSLRIKIIALFKQVF